MRERISGGIFESSGEMVALRTCSSFWPDGELLRFRSLEGRFPLFFFVLALDAIADLWTVECESFDTQGSRVDGCR
jgi:hypothetical protein